MKVVVVDIGGTSIKSALCKDGKLEQIKEKDTDARKGGTFVIEKVKEIIHKYSEFEGIGVSTAGLVDLEKGIIAYANSNIPSYTGMKVKEILEREFQVPVAVENDVNCAAIGELNYGAAKGYQNFLCLTYGTGVGGAIVLNRRVYRGIGQGAGEFGAMIIHPEHRNFKGDNYSGCYEKYASTTALVQKVKEINPQLNTGRKVFEHFMEPGVEAIFNTWIDEIVIGLVNLIHIFNPPCIVLGGGIMAQKKVIDKIREKIYNSIIPVYGEVKIVQANLGNEAGMLGAGRNVLDLLKNRES